MTEHWRARFSKWVEVEADDPKVRRRGQFLSYCILGALVFSIFLVVMNGSQWLFAPATRSAASSAGGVLSALILVGLWRLNRAEHTQWAGYGFLTLSTVAISLLSPPPILERMLSLPVFAASFVIGPAGSFLVAGLAFVIRVLIYLASSDPLAFNVFSTAALFLVASIAWLVADQQERYIGQVGHLNDVLRAIRNVNQLITREKDRQRLLQTSCELLTEARGYRSAWIVQINNDGVPIMAAEAGIGTAFAALQERWLAGQMPGCARQALEQSDTYLVRDPTVICADCPLLNISERPGKCAVRLTHEGTVFGVLVVSGPLEFLASSEERALLEEVAEDLAFALYSIDLEAQQKQAEAVLRESEERYRTLIEQASDGIFIANDQGQFTQVNSAGCQMSGYTRQEILKKTMRDLTKPVPDHSLNFEALRQGKTLLYERELIRKDGTLAPVEISMKQLTDGSFQAIARDITERKRALEAIQSVARFPDENPNPVLRVAGDSTLLYANAGSAPLLALWNCAIGARLPEDMQRVVSELFAVGTSREVEVTYGDTTYTLTFMPLVDAGYANIYGRDITERKQSEEAVRVSEARYRSLIKNQSDVIARSDLMGNLTFVNDAYCRFFGKAREELLGTDFMPTVLPEDLPISRGALEAIQLPPNRRLTETRHPTPAGMRWLSWENSAVIDERGNVIELQGVGRDITESKRAEEALRRFAGRMAALNRLDQVIAANLEIGLVYDNFVKELLPLVSLDRTSIVLLNEAEDQWQVTGQWPQHQPVILPGEWKPVKGSAMEWLVTNRVPFLEGEIGTRGNWIETALLQGEGLRSRLLLPLIIHERIVGALTAASRQPNAFSEEDQDILTTIADQLAIAIQNTHLYEQVQRHAVELEQRVAERTAQLQATNQQLEGEITERKHVEAALRESEEQFRRLAEAAFEAVVIHEGGVLLSANDQYCEMFGYELKELLGKQVLSLTVAPEGLDAVKKEIATGGVGPYESIGLRKDGTRFPMEIRVRETEYEGRKVRVSAIMDITEHKRAEEALRRRTTELETANHELEAFAYSVSHDLRAPLRAISGYAHMLTEDYQARLDDEGRRILGVVCGEARRMGQLIDDLLAFSRLGRQAMRKAATDMTTLASQAFDELRQETPEREVNLRLADLPSVEADPSLLRQVWMNLLGNALKFTRGRAPAEIEVGCVVQDNETVYYVKDNGVGFDMQYASKLFGVFQRLHGQDEFEGTGVGLALVQRIILRHGGRVWAEAKEYQGATFFFSLPRYKESSV
jgi:PAS domain S-box-containing protein